MLPNDPQFLYLVLVLPSLFGLTLVGDGLNKVVHGDVGGYISIIFGVLFLAVVIFAFIFFSSYLDTGT